MLLNYSNIFIFLLFSLFLSVLIFNLSFILIKQKDDLEKLTAMNEDLILMMMLERLLM